MREHEKTRPHREQSVDRMPSTALAVTRTPGEPLPEPVRTSMEARFGHDFTGVRIHDGAVAHEAAQDLSAHAFTIGSDIAFAHGRYAPESPDGARMLAHELAHVVQQDGRPQAGEVEVTDAGDSTETSANAAADAVIEGRSAIGLAGSAASQPGAALVQRWPWDDDSGGGGGGILGTLSSVASSVVDTASSAGSAVASAASSVVDTASSAGSFVYDSYQKSTDFKGLGNTINSGLDWLGDQSDKGNQKMVEDASGIPVLGTLAQGLASFNNVVSQGTTGVLKGGTDIVTGIAQGLAHPIDALSGMEGLLEHNTTVPFLGSTLKAGHGLYDLAANGGGQYGNSLGDLANHVLNPLQSSQDDAAYNTAVFKGIVAPGEEDKGGGWQAWSDRPVEAGMRAVTNVLPFLLGAEGELGAAAESKGGSIPRAPALPEAPPIPDVPPPSVPPPTSRGMPTLPGTGPGRTPTLLPPDFVPIEPAPPTSRGMPTLPGTGPGRTPTLLPPEFVPEVPSGPPPSSGRPVPSSFPDVPSFPSELPPESAPPSGPKTPAANAGHARDLAQERELAKHNAEIEKRGGGQFPPAPDLGDWRRWLPKDFNPFSWD